MFPKLIAILACSAVIATLLLCLRQQRLDLAHDMIGHHRQIDRSRQATWTLQVELNGRLSPPALHKTIEEAGIKIEPIMPLNRPPRDASQLARGQVIDD